MCTCRKSLAVRPLIFNTAIIYLSLFFENFSRRNDCRSFQTCHRSARRSTCVPSSRARASQSFHSSSRTAALTPCPAFRIHLAATGRTTKTNNPNKPRWRVLVFSSLLLLSPLLIRLRCHSATIPRSSLLSCCLCMCHPLFFSVFPCISRRSHSRLWPNRAAKEDVSFLVTILNNELVLVLFYFLSSFFSSPFSHASWIFFSPFVSTLKKISSFSHVA